ncbi:MAG: DNA-binding protein [Flavobacterium sp.]|nr:MAG: DNA-binding protein [Flavobacterium sp.]
MNQIFLTGVDLNELLGKIGQLIDERLSKLPPDPEKPPFKFISRAEVAKLLKISLPTLHDWTKLGILQSYKIGNRVLYKLAEVEQALTKAETFKHKKGGFHA